MDEHGIDLVCHIRASVGHDHDSVALVRQAVREQDFVQPAEHRSESLTQVQADGNDPVEQGHLSAGRLVLSLADRLEPNVAVIDEYPMSFLHVVDQAACRPDRCDELGSYHDWAF